MMIGVMRATIRDYRDDDEQRWLCCRVLGFLDTAYFDDVWRVRPATGLRTSLVAARGDTIVGLCEASPASHGATIDSIVVHPDHRRHGIGSALIAELTHRLKQQEISQLDAWTRDDQDTLAWYQAAGFKQSYRYLHVYATGTAEMAEAATVSPDLLPRAGFFHADTQDPEVEADLRRRFSRVHACHRFVLAL